VQRSVTEGKGVGRSLNTTTKNEGAQGTHRLGPKAIELLRKRQTEQADEKIAAGTLWKQWQHDGTEVSLVFTSEDGHLGSRQKVVELRKIVPATTRRRFTPPEAPNSDHVMRKGSVSNLDTAL
jgi:hypothetical protein